MMGAKEKKVRTKHVLQVPLATRILFCSPYTLLLYATRQITHYNPVCTIITLLVTITLQWYTHLPYTTRLCVPHTHMQLPVVCHSDYYSNNHPSVYILISCILLRVTHTQTQLPTVCNSDYYSNNHPFNHASMQSLLFQCNYLLHLADIYKHMVISS